MKFTKFNLKYCCNVIISFKGQVCSVHNEIIVLQDFGYGSVRSASSRNTDRSSDWSAQTTPESTINRTKAAAANQPAAPGDTQVFNLSCTIDILGTLR